MATTTMDQVKPGDWITVTGPMDIGTHVEVQGRPNLSAGDVVSVSGEVARVDMRDGSHVVVSLTEVGGQRYSLLVKPTTTVERRD